jgi:hypothetical protein
MQKREKIHKIDEKGVKVECVNIQIFARTQQKNEPFKIIYLLNVQISPLIFNTKQHSLLLLIEGL